MHSFLRSMLAIAAIGAATSVHAEVITVTNVPRANSPLAYNTWLLANYRDVSTSNPGKPSTTYSSNTVAAITDANARSGNGSVEMSMSDGTGKADFVYYWGYQSDRTLGTLTTLGFDWYRGDSAVAAHFAPAFRLRYDADGDIGTPGDNGYLIWERGYQGIGPVHPAETNQWVETDLMKGEFYQRTTQEIPGYDVFLDAWKAGYAPANADADALSARSAILGIEFGIGSGWGGQFAGNVDNVRLGFGGDSTTFNFELAQAEVPEPASLALMGLGLLGLAAGRRRKLS